MHTVFTKNRSQPVLDWFFSPGLKGRTETIWTWQLLKPATVVRLQPELVWSSCINVTYHFVHEKVASHEAVLTYVPTKENIADILMKGLKLHQHHYLMGKLGFGARDLGVLVVVLITMTNNHQTSIHLNEGLRVFSTPEVWCTSTAVAEQQSDRYE